MTTYLPGDLATLVSDQGVVIAAGDRLAEVVTLLERGLDPLTVVEVLSRGVLSDLPDFAAVRIDRAELRILVRGMFEVRIDGFAIDGRTAATWNEAAAPLLDRTLVAISPLGATPTGIALPLARGVVRSAGVTWCPRADPAPAPESPPVVESTVVRSTPPAPSSAPAPAPPPAPSPAPAPPSVEHDGHTITSAQLQALREGQAPSGAVPPVPPAPPTRPLVALQLSTGRVVQVRRRVLIGRSPRVQQVGGSANLPALVTVDDPYVSSTHLEVAADGVRVTATDTSTNGTLLARRGRAPVPLDPGVATEVAVGDVLTLSKGLTATVVPAPGRG